MNPAEPQFDKTIAPVLPVKNVAAALEHYRSLGFESHAYQESDADGPIYGYVCLGASPAQHTAIQEPTRMVDVELRLTRNGA